MSSPILFFTYILYEFIITNKTVVLKWETNTNTVCDERSLVSVCVALVGLYLCQ
jgi:hypothetical protein